MVRLLALPGQVEQVELRGYSVSQAMGSVPLAKKVTQGVVAELEEQKFPSTPSMQELQG